MKYGIQLVYECQRHEEVIYPIMLPLITEYRTEDLHKAQ